MLKDKNKIKVVLTSYGSLRVVVVPVELNKDSYNYIDIECLVPKTVNSVTTALVKVYGTTTNTEGRKTWASQTYDLPYQKDALIDGQEYQCYQGPLPQEFCTINGSLGLTFAYVSTDDNGVITSLLPSATLNLYVKGNGFNPSGIVLANQDVIAAKVNQLQQEKVDKVDAEAELVLVSDGAGGMKPSTLPIKEYADQKAYIDELLNIEAANRSSADADLQSQVTALSDIKADKTAVTAEITAAISAVVDDAPEAFDTLKEVSDWIKSDESGTEALVTRVGAIETKNTEQDTALSNETIARTSADTTLQTNINAEASSRQTADETLQSNIDAEVSSRQTADTKLQNNLDTAISTEASARTTADTTLQTNIDNETSARTKADTTLQTDINSEITNRTNEDTALQSQIDTLDTVKANKTDVTAEINSAVSAVVDSAPEAFDTLKEIADWIAQDESGTSALVARVTAIETKNDEQDTTLATETSERKSADGTLQNNINAEASARQTADNTLTNSKLDNVTIASGSTNGTIKLTKTINGSSSSTDNIAVAGLKSAAYEESSAFATASQGTLADNAVRSIESGTASTNGKVRLVVNTGGTSANVETAVTGLSAVATSGDYNDLSNLPNIPDGSVLYDSTGTNTDGAMTQKAVTDELTTKLDISQGAASTNMAMVTNTNGEIEPSNTIPLGNGVFVSSEKDAETGEVSFVISFPEEE